MFEINVNFGKCYGWLIKEMEGCDGEKALHLCLPIERNGITITKKKRPYWSLKMCGRFLVPTLHKDVREKLINEGLLYPDDARPTAVVGVLRKFKE